MELGQGNKPPLGVGLEWPGGGDKREYIQSRTIVAIECN